MLPQQQAAIYTETWWGSGHDTPALTDSHGGPGSTQPFNFVENPDSSVFPLSQFQTESKLQHLAQLQSL